VLTTQGVPLQVLPMPGSSTLVGICADSSHVCVVDQTHAKVRVLSFLNGEGRTAFGTPRCGEPHLPPFLYPTELCDAAHPSIVALSKRLIPQGCSAARGAAAVRLWVRTHIKYVLRDKAESASQTLECREGMCTNKANLQCALLRAAGIPAGFVLVHITKEAFAGPAILDEVYEMIQAITIHCFCASYIPFVAPPASGGPHAEADLPPLSPQTELGVFRHYDATERQGASHLTEYVPYTDETRYKQRWLRGPFSPVQGNLDHMLKPGSKIPPDVLARQNELYRAHPI